MGILDIVKRSGNTFGVLMIEFQSDERVKVQSTKTERMIEQLELLGRKARRCRSLNPQRWSLTP
jgi:hypothetical protein